MSKQRQPWPMKWIVLAILLAVVPYTFVTLRYRKPGPAFQPYEDMKNRANVSRLLSAGYQRVPLEADQPADPAALRNDARIAAASGGLPTELAATLVEPPLLPAKIVRVAAPATGNTLLAYPIRFTCAVTDDQRQPAGAALFIKESEVILTPTFERLNGQLLTRTREPTVHVTIPAGTLKPGTYVFTIVGERESRTWQAEIR